MSASVLAGCQFHGRTVYAYAFKILEVVLYLQAHNFSIIHNNSKKSQQIQQENLELGIGNWELGIGNWECNYVNL